MGCAPSRMGPQKERKMRHRQKRKVSNCNGTERGLHTSRILMMNNDVEPMKGGRQGQGGRLSENFETKGKNNNQKRPRSLLAMLLGGTPKIDTCKSSAETENEINCDDNNNVAQCPGGRVGAGQQANQFGGINRFLLDSANRTEISSQLQMPIASRKRKSFNQANSGASANKMHITETETVELKGESASGNQQETRNIIESQSQFQTSAPQSVASSIASRSPESQVDEDTNRVSAPRRNSTDISLFTSIHQLCSDIIQRDLLHRSSLSAKNINNHPNPGRILCLFIFGCQGSAKGEVAYELVEHSDLTRVLNTSDTNKNLQLAQTNNCPLYHHIDVAAIIAANIDERIHEYHQLSAQAATIRQKQAALYDSSLKFSTETMDEFAWRREHPGDDKENSGRKDDREESKSDNDKDDPVVSSDIVSNESDRPSIASNDSSHSTGISKLKSTRLSLDEDSNLITLTTKQRSILQLKLMKYFKSITSKWVFSLIQKEIDRLELRLKQSLLDTREEESSTQKEIDRIYLINLVPNQLSLFKSCLYLQQNLQLWDFCYPVWALKFERRTNIKLLHKERAINSDNSKSDESHQSKSKLIKIPSLRLPKLNGGRSTSAQSQPSSPKSNSGAGSSCGTSGNAKELGEVATGFLANGVNEKLGPKFNDNFAQQFKHMNRLSRVRYNPIRDYNYSLHDDQDGSKCWRLDRPPETASKQQHSQPYHDDNHGARFKSSDINDNVRDNLDRTIPLEYRPMDRIISSSMQHLQDDSVAATSSSSSTMVGENLDDLRHRLSLSRISNSPLVNVSSSPALPISKDNQLMKPGSQVSLFLSSTSSLVSNDTISTVESEGNHSQRLSSAKQGSILSSEGPIKWAIGLEMYENKDSSSSLRSKQFAKDEDDDRVANRARWRGSSSAGTKRIAAGGSMRPADPSIGGSQLIPGNKSNSTKIYFHEPKSSRSPLMFTAQHQRRPVSYQLVPVRVAYANDQSQVQYELTRTHPPTIRLKSHSDILRLAKLIGKAKVQVSTECQTWLYAALTKEGLCLQQHQQKSSISQQQQLGDDLGHLNSLRLARQRHSATKHHQFNLPAADNYQQPALIVYVIRVDISRLKSGHFHHSPNFIQQSESLCRQSSTSFPPATSCPDIKQTDKDRENKCLVPILTLQSASPDELPDGCHLVVEDGDTARNIDNQRPSSSGRSAISTRKPAEVAKRSVNEKPKRRVQFRLSQAPQVAWAHGDHSMFGQLMAERRLWLEDCTYLSSKWEETNLETMELLAALLRFTKK